MKGAWNASFVNGAGLPTSVRKEVRINRNNVVVSYVAELSIIGVCEK